MDQVAGNLPTETAKVLGFTVENLTDELKERYGYEDQTGVVVKDIEPNSRAARNGMRQGTLIKEVNKQPIRSTREFNQAVERARKKGLQRILLLVYIEDTSYFVSLMLN